MRVLVLLFLLALFAPLAQATEATIDLITATGTIHGTLRLPDVTVPVPVVLLVAGSGPTDRNGNSALTGGNNDSLKLLAQALAEAGLASVRYDKRGIAASRAAGPAEADLRFDHYVDDAAAWLRQLSGDARFTGVAIAGHSEGALIALLAAKLVPVSAYMSIAGPAEDAATVLRRQLQGRLPPALAQRSDSILAGLEAGDTTTDVPPELQALYRPSVQPYLISWLRQRPTDAIAGLAAPCLIVQGGTDIQVTRTDAVALHAANPSCELAIVEGMNHVLKAVPDDNVRQMLSYSDPNLPLAPEFVTAIERFMTAVFFATSQQGASP
jgi:hypothetical protein